MDDLAIKVENVSKTFILPQEKHTSLKSAFVHFYKRRKYEKQQALKDITFDIKRGEFFGIVGRNGSGKSTLLKLLAGIYTPTTGTIHVNGKLTPFIELGVGFNPELTGRENVFLNGALLGFNRKEMLKMYKDIVDFAELKKFMDQKLKNYSSGMQVRLAFSIAIRAKSDILLIDEVLAVGDENFQRKCYNYFSKVKKEGKTVVFVSHDMNAVRDYCDRAILINNGEIILIDSSATIAVQYNRLNSMGNSDEELRKQRNIMRWGDGKAVIKKIQISSGGKKTNAIYKDDPLEVTFEINTVEEIKRPVVGMVIQNSFGNQVFATNTKELNLDFPDLKRGETIYVKFQLEKNIYTDGSYNISGAITNYQRTDVYSRVEEEASFTVNGWTLANAIAHPVHTVTLNR